VTPEAFDTQYMAWLMKKVGTRVERFDEWREQLKAFVELSKATDLDGTALAKALVEIIQLYPEYVGDANAYEFLAKAQLAKKDDKGAEETLNAYVSEGGENPDALKQLASLQEETGDKKAAAVTLERLNFIYPEDQALHSKLGALLLAEHDNAGAVREFSAVIAMKPLDMASAEFDLARAYFAAGDKVKAEDSVLASLEAAPGFKDAQKLLVEIEAGKSGQDSNGVTNQPK
jgi:Tfp pilus assembly protein PilF